MALRRYADSQTSSGLEGDLSNGAIPGGPVPTSYASVSGASKRDSREPARILVVDDEPVILDILRDILEFEGHSVEAVGDGLTALGRLAEQSFDVLLTDMKMPKLDGLELIRRARSDGVGEKLKIVLMTGFGTVETAVEAMKRGAFDYILKPFKPEDVVRLIDRALTELSLELENIALKETIGFYELSETLGSSLVLGEQLGVIGKLVQQNLGADAVALHTLSDDGRRRFVPRYVSDERANAVDAGRVFERLGTDAKVLAHGAEVEPFAVDGALPAGLMAVPLRARGEVFGVLAAVLERSGRRFTEGQRKGLQVFGQRAASAIEQDRMYQDLRDSFATTIEALARALEAKDPYTSGHSDRVAIYGRLIGESLGLTTSEQARIYHGGLLHDIGKIGINLSVLNKAQKLTVAEYEMFKSHTILGRRIVEPVAAFRPLIPFVFSHHEAWNGRGYPDGLAGEAIPFEGRLLAVADSYDAMTSNRPYRKALPHDIAVAELRRCSGSQFDSQMVDAFLRVIDDHRSSQSGQGCPVPE